MFYIPCLKNVMLSLISRLIFQFKFEYLKKMIFHIGTNNLVSKTSVNTK